MSFYPTEQRWSPFQRLSATQAMLYTHRASVSCSVPVCLKLFTGTHLLSPSGEWRLSQPKYFYRYWTHDRRISTQVQLPVCHLPPPPTPNKLNTPENQSLFRKAISFITSCESTLQIPSRALNADKIFKTSHMLATASLSQTHNETPYTSAHLVRTSSPVVDRKSVV